MLETPSEAKAHGFKTIWSMRDRKTTLRSGSRVQLPIPLSKYFSKAQMSVSIDFFDKDRHRREEVRLRWWDQNATTFRKAGLGMEKKRNTKL